ncbi:MAG TPA: glutaredoxin domain-containing protein, partial [Burkholderiales bacterium]|nr:glutaredoxin domain-containing protein [Burkholderiales bacterium]
MLLTAARILLLCAAALAALPVFAQLYRWTDEKGVIHYSDKAPEKGGAKAVEVKINSYSGPATVSSTGAPAGGAAKPKVKMLATAWCGYCARARAYLNSRGIPFEELDVEKSAQGKQEYRDLKGRGVPIILVGNQRMNGYDQARLESMLRAAG